MSGTSDKVSTPLATPPVSRGTVIISIVGQFTFFLALIAAAVIAWVRNDYTLLTAMAGVAATNATAIVNYWIGTSNESASKNSLLVHRQTP